MRILSLLFALIVSLVSWALVLVLSDGVAPLGKVGHAEGWVFFAPIAIFALPLATLAFVRGHVLAASWLFALAPWLGFANFALSAAKALRTAPTGHAAAAGPSTNALLWGALLAVVLVLLALGKRLSPSAATR